MKKLILSTLVLWVALAHILTVFKCQVIPGSELVQEFGFGVQGITHYLKKLLEGCDNVGNLDNWIIFMESCLACEDEAWPYEPDKEKLNKTDMQLMNSFCDAWPKRWKCGSRLAKRLDSCYGTSIENGKIGSNSLRFSNAFARHVCQNKLRYLDNLAVSKYLRPVDRRSLNCFEDNKVKIQECTSFASKRVQDTRANSSSNFCKNVQNFGYCFESIYLDNCESQDTKDWVKFSIHHISTQLNC